MCSFLATRPFAGDEFGSGETVDASDSGSAFRISSRDRRLGNVSFGSRLVQGRALACQEAWGGNFRFPQVKELLEGKWKECPTARESLLRCQSCRVLDPEQAGTEPVHNPSCVEIPHPSLDCNPIQPCFCLGEGKDVNSVPRYNMTGPPKITATVPLETSGIVEAEMDCLRSPSTGQSIKRRKS